MTSSAAEANSSATQISVATSSRPNTSVVPLRSTTAAMPAQPMATSMTPIQFQKQIRLQEARALLMTAPANVAEIGYLVGYESPGRDATRLKVSQRS